MPPKAKYTKNEIVGIALKLARKNGFESITTRDIARELGASTRPIFTYFKSMDELKSEVLRSAVKIYDGYAERGLKEPIPFLGYGISLYRFAVEESNLFKLLFLTPFGGRLSGAREIMQRSKERVRETLKNVYKIDDKSADFFFEQLWLVGHGISSVVAMGASRYSEEDIIKIYTMFSVSIYKAMKEIPGFVDGAFDSSDIFTKLIDNK